MALALGADTDIALAAVDDGFADGKSEARTLHVVIQLDKAFEDSLLLVLGNARTGVLAIEVESGLGVALFPTIAHTDVTLLGVLDGISDKVSQQLLYAPLVEHGRTCIVGIVLQERQPRLLNALLQRHADVVEDWCQIDVRRLDGHGLPHARGFQDVVDESQQHVAVGTDDAYELLAIVW